jgi:hypothetical protein
MANETDNFVQSMLKQAKEKQAVKPQSRCEGVQQNEIEQLTKNIQQTLQQQKKKK